MAPREHVSERIMMFPYIRVAVSMNPTNPRMHPTGGRADTGRFVITIVRLQNVHRHSAVFKPKVGFCLPTTFHRIRPRPSSGPGPHQSDVLFVFLLQT
ncbi:hypothetical protein J6590_035302 [Homalodisca vitripennis]|nr:hypothetical protein J6590_035302 [Homalodisca vitripennis]